MLVCESGREAFAHTPAFWRRGCKWADSFHHRCQCMSPASRFAPWGVPLAVAAAVAVWWLRRPAPPPPTTRLRCFDPGNANAIAAAVRVVGHVKPGQRMQPLVVELECVHADIGTGAQLKKEIGELYDAATQVRPQPAPRESNQEA